MKTLVFIIGLMFLSFGGYAQCGFSEYELKTDTLNFSVGMQNAVVPAGSKVLWPFYAEVGRLYAFSTCTSAVDSYLEVYDSSKEVVAENDDDGLYCMGSSASIAWQCTKSGYYYVGLSAYGCGFVESETVLQYGYPSSQQLSSALVYAYTNSGGNGQEKLQVYLVDIITEGVGESLSADKFLFDFSPLGNEIDFKSAELYYIGQDEYFNISEYENGNYNRIGSPAASPSGMVEFEGAENLFTGNNYFALVVNVAENATVGNKLTVKLESFTVDGQIMLADPIEGHITVSPFSEYFINYDWYWGSVSWGDVDADGDFDLLISEGLLKNNKGKFDEEPVDATNYANFTKFVDFNNDSLLDVFSSEDGAVYESDGQVYVNKGKFSFSEQDADKIPMFWNDGGIASVDINNDGLNDIVYCGYVESRADSYVFINTGDGFVQDENQVIIGLDYSDLDVGDYDNDGDMDLIMCGEDRDGDFVTILYQNKDGLFIDAGIEFEDVAAGSVEFGDYDEDGDLDILLSGMTDHTNIDPVSLVYENNGGQFAEKYYSLEGIFQGQAHWVDYDADGDLDIHLYGAIEKDGASTSMFYENKNGDFLYDGDYGIIGTTYSKSEWGDIDGDGDPDFVVNGNNSNSEIVVYVYENNLGEGNQKPQVPSGLSTAVSGTDVVLSWEQSSDKETQNDAVRYNVRIGTKPGAGDVVNAKALASGRQLLPDCSNVGTQLQFNIDSLTPGEYYWTVQSLDLSGNASPFAKEERFFIALPPEICVVSSNERGQNIIVWERNSNRGIKEYAVYRESDKTDVYEKIGTVPFDSIGVFVDTISDIEEESFSYKLSIIDSTGYETDLSSFHRTIHLQTSLTHGADAQVNVEWNRYEGAEVVSYEIYRGTDSKNMSLVKTLSGNQFTWSDKLPEVDTYYMISAVLNKTCYPALLKTDSGPYSYSLSNISEVKLGSETGFPDELVQPFSFYPVPSSEYLYVTTEYKHFDADYKLLNMQASVLLEGKLVGPRTKIDLTSVPNGVYLLVLSANEKVYSRSITVTK